MKILYDSQSFDMQQSGGISRYFVEIIKNLPTEFSYSCSTGYSKNTYLVQSSLISLSDNVRKQKMDSFLPKLDFKGKGKLHTLRNKVLYPNFVTNRERDIVSLKNQDFDVFHPTYYDPYFLDYIGNKPFVLTIHDMIHEKFPEMFCDIKTIENKRLLAQKAAHIIAISEQTKNDIIDMLEISAEKISVVYHGISALCDNIVNSSKNKYGRYFLFTGTRNIYKNFYFMLISLSDLFKKNPDVKLVCTSSDFNDFERQLIRHLGLENQVIHTFFETDAQMHELYQNAVAFIFPSYYEGFGIPILEAFEANCPCVLADASCFREIAQNAALYFEPKNKTQLKNALEKLLVEDSLRKRLIQKGKLRLKEFSWKKAAEQTALVYQTALEKWKRGGGGGDNSNVISAKILPRLIQG